MTSRMDVVGQNGNDGLAYAGPTDGKQPNALTPDGSFWNESESSNIFSGHILGHENLFDAKNTPKSGSNDFREEKIGHENQSESKTDMVNRPPHYQSQSGIECIDAIRAQMTDEEFRGYCKGNVAKYLWRWREKGGVESLRKAKWYLDKMIEDIVHD